MVSFPFLGARSRPAPYSVITFAHLLSREDGWLVSPWIDRRIDKYDYYHRRAHGITPSEIFRDHC